MKAPKAPAAGDATKLARRNKNKLLLESLKAKLGLHPKVSTKGLTGPPPVTPPVGLLVVPQ